MPNPSVVSRLLVAGAVTAGLTGCGHVATVGRSRSVQIALTEYRVTPQSIQSPAGELTLRVENDGRLTHTLAITRHGKILGQTGPLPPGARTILIISLNPGRYLMTSTLLSDQDLGEYGTLNIVR
jgi:hypothetical protein